MWALCDTQAHLENNPGSTVAATGSDGSKTGASASKKLAFVASLALLLGQCADLIVHSQASQ